MLLVGLKFSAKIDVAGLTLKVTTLLNTSTTLRLIIPSTYGKRIRP